VAGIHAVDLVLGFGTLHCLTQQEPAEQPFISVIILAGQACPRERWEVIVVQDGEEEPAEEGLAAVRERPRRAADCVVAGRAVNALKDNPYSKATQQMADYLLSRSNSSPEQATLALGNSFGGACRGVPGAGRRWLAGLPGSVFPDTAAGWRIQAAGFWREGRIHAAGIQEQILHHAQFQKREPGFVWHDALPAIQSEGWDAEEQDLPPGEA
jgi:hypothetical protein